MQCMRAVSGTVFTTASFREDRTWCFVGFGPFALVHGCFWHRHEACPYATVPATRPKFWQAKFRANVERDRVAREELMEAGWRVAIVWECALRKDGANRTSSMLEQWLRSDKRYFETALG